MAMLNVYFINDKEHLHGTATLIEDIITDSVTLELANDIFMDEVHTFIGKCVEILRKRYNHVDVKIHWDSLEVE